jgi:hypothetical protein
MRGLAIERSRRIKGSDNVPDLFLSAVSGFLMGAVTLLSYALVGALSIALAQNATGTVEMDEALPKGGAEVAVANNGP